MGIIRKLFLFFLLFYRRLDVQPSSKLEGMLINLPKASNRIWTYKNAYNLEKGFRRQRKRVANKLGNPRILQIYCHTLRHWKAIIEYAKTKDILYIQKLL